MKFKWFTNEFPKEVLNLNQDILSFGKEERIKAHNKCDHEIKKEEEEEIEEIIISPFLLNYLTIINNEEWGKRDQFLDDFCSLLSMDIPFNEGDVELFSNFAHLFISQIVLQNDEKTLYLHLKLFYQLQLHFRFISNITCNDELLQLLSNFLNINDLEIQSLLIHIFTQFLPINPELVSRICLNKIFFFLTSQSNICLITSSFKFMDEILKYRVLDQQSIIIFIKLMKKYSDETSDQKIIQILISIFQKILNFSMQTFLISFDHSTLKLIENLLIKSEGNNLINALNLVIIISNIKNPKLELFFNEFDLLILQNFIFDLSNPFDILSIHCIHNFIMLGMQKKVISSNFVEFFMEIIEKSRFEKKKEILLCLIHLLEFSPKEIKISLLMNEKFLFNIIDALSTLNIPDILMILNILYSSFNHLKVSNDFESLKDVFTSTNFFQTLESIYSENMNNGETLDESREVYQVLKLSRELAALFNINL
ncbi:hypothetical protein TRFO_20927 [Tritrichomonas foetus]|uniref:SPIN90/Ldb17 leucine-rich domain-containing protein n=1 Tax=Tritrichomonas foetus TaxID=1144522 RepID=A0A1J4KK05_9EUKA|nr:hypothetical protein TRFO_20927 [Tritrichomonas foetus]|eukprot:OHT10014.1 hypothetical protein TRFO_20927 [Tritrichomonas foetus]